MAVNNQPGSESEQHGVYIIDVDTGQTVHLEAREETVRGFSAWSDGGAKLTPVAASLRAVRQTQKKRA